MRKAGEARRVSSPVNPHRIRIMDLHIPVMPAQTLEQLDAARGGLFVDATLGMGGHSELILRASPDNRVIGLDRDGEAIEIARKRLEEFGGRFVAYHSDFRRIKQIKEIIEESSAGMGEGSVAGILADLGISSYQLGTPERGFSFRAGQHGSASSPGSPLDMRMDRSQSLTAAELVNKLSERELADIIFRYGEEKASRRIARMIVASRAKTPIETTAQLADLVVKAINKKGHWKIHPATRTFQAFRIAVNRELEGLDQFVADAIDLLGEDGRLVVITFHSLEDRIIKQALRFQSGHCICPPNQPECRCGTARRVEILTRKAIQPGEDEIASNPRARSARLRACRKIEI